MMKNCINNVTKSILLFLICLAITSSCALKQENILRINSTEINATAVLEDVELNEDMCFRGIVRITFHKGIETYLNIYEINDELFQRFRPVVIVKNETTVHTPIRRHKIGHTQVDDKGVVELSIEINEPLGSVLEDAEAISVSIPEFDNEFVLFVGCSDNKQSVNMDTISLNVSPFGPIKEGPGYVTAAMLISDGEVTILSGKEYMSQNCDAQEIIRYSQVYDKASELCWEINEKYDVVVTCSGKGRYAAIMYCPVNSKTNVLETDGVYFLFETDDLKAITDYSEER